MDAVLDRNFIEGYSKTKNDLYDELNSRIDTVILNFIKGFLKEKKIEFDDTIIDLKEFKNTVVPQLDEQTRLDIANIEKGMHERLVNIADELKDGSTTAFGKFANIIGSFAKSTVEMTARIAAVKTTMALFPTFGGAALRSIYFYSKDCKDCKRCKKRFK